jgi:hypothetical protein
MIAEEALVTSVCGFTAVYISRNEQPFGTLRTFSRGDSFENKPLLAL